MTALTAEVAQGCPSVLTNFYRFAADKTAKSSSFKPPPKITGQENSLGVPSDQLWEKNPDNKSWRGDRRQCFHPRYHPESTETALSKCMH